MRHNERLECERKLFFCAILSSTLEVVTFTTHNECVIDKRLLFTRLPSPVTLVHNTQAVVSTYVV